MSFKLRREDRDRLNQGGSKVRKRWLYRVLLGAVTLITTPSFAQFGNGSINTNHQGPFNLAKAYPCTAGSDDAGLGIADLGVVTGTCPAQIGNPGATPGMLCLQRTG